MAKKPKSPTDHGGSAEADEVRKAKLEAGDPVDGAIETSARMTRRSLFGVLAVPAAGAATTALSGCFLGGGYSSGVTDGDSGQWADPSGGGRGSARGVVTGLTDGDQGAHSDPSGQGRGARGVRSGLTDNDSGAYADSSGNGRGTTRLGYTGLSDSDGGAYADSAGHGRGRR